MKEYPKPNTKVREGVELPIKIDVHRVKYGSYAQLKKDRGTTCASCGGLGYQIDHIIPVVMGGAIFDITNTQVLCRQCHLKKSGIDRSISHLMTVLGILDKVDAVVYYSYITLAELQSTYTHLYSLHIKAQRRYREYLEDGQPGYEY